MFPDFLFMLQIISKDSIFGIQNHDIGAQSIRDAAGFVIGGCGTATAIKVMISYMFSSSALV